MLRQGSGVAGKFSAPGLGHALGWERRDFYKGVDELYAVIDDGEDAAWGRAADFGLDEREGYRGEEEEVREEGGAHSGGVASNP